MTIDSTPNRWLAGLLLVFAAIAPLAAQEPRDAETRGAAVSHVFRDLGEVSSASLLSRTESGFVELPILAIDVELSVTGVLVHGRVTQRFVNTQTTTIEAIYAFPVPDRAAVHEMEMRIGERRIRSVVQEREAAKRSYTRARESGKKAALVAQQRPNLFTTTVANINAGETVEVTIEYYEELAWRDGEFRLRFPLASSSAVPEVHLTVELRPGVPLGELISDSHEISVATRGDVHDVRIRDVAAAADRDFLLRWTPVVGERTRTSVFVEEREDALYVMTMLIPPNDRTADGPGLPTETLFIIDVSGSMQGPSIRHAREALIAALDRLRPDDRFNVIRFNHESEAFRPEFAHADAVSLAAARAWVGGLAADGGTQIRPALLRGIEMAGNSSTSHAQRIIFLTDGAVSDAESVFESMLARLGDIRLHTIGIGQAPNTHLMRKMAELGRGLSEFVPTTAMAGNRIDAFFAKLDRPVMTDLDLQWDGVELDEPYPRRLPDLYAGEPLVLYSRVVAFEPTAEPRLTGFTDHGWIELRSDTVETVRRGSGIATRWARARVEDLVDSLRDGADPDDVRREVVDLALDHGIVTRFTSLVAVEDVPTAIDAPRPLRIAAALPRGGTDARLRLLVGGVLLVWGAIAWLAAQRWRA